MGAVVIRASMKKNIYDVIYYHRRQQDSAHTVAFASTSTAMAAMLYGMAVIDDKGPWDEDRVHRQGCLWYYRLIEVC